MNPAASRAPARPREGQFSLLALMEFTTICAVVAAFSPVVGVATAIFLMGLALALAAKRGMLALVAFALINLVADWPNDPVWGHDGSHPLFALVIAAALCAWYRIRAGLLHRTRNARPPIRSFAAARLLSDSHAAMRTYVSLKGR